MFLHPNAKGLVPSRAGCGTQTATHTGEASEGNKKMKRKHVAIYSRILFSLGEDPNIDSTHY